MEKQLFQTKRKGKKVIIASKQFNFRDLSVISIWYHKRARYCFVFGTTILYCSLLNAQSSSKGLFLSLFPANIRKKKSVHYIYLDKLHFRSYTLDDS